MKKFKIGDKVKLKSGIGTVIERDSESDGFYKVSFIKHDLYPYVYSAEMLELADCKETNFCPNQILKSGNRTIVFWSDGTKTIVKRAEDEPDNDYAAFTAALGIKIFGSNSALRRTIKRKTTVQAKK